MTALMNATRVDIPAIYGSTNESVTFKIDTDYAGALWCEFFRGSPNTKHQYVSGAPRDKFIEVLLYILNQQNVRLFPVDQPLLAIEWTRTQNYAASSSSSS